MKGKIKVSVSIFLAGLWVNACEFLRNSVLLKSYWTGHYESLGMVFPSKPVNGMVWVTWGFVFAVAVYLISRRYGLVMTAIISWIMAFVLMWLVIWNLGVLPVSILAYAIPFSLLEAFVAAFICVKAGPGRQGG